MPDLEAVGDVITGGVVGRVVEPSAGEHDGDTQETHCLNCGTTLVGGYCHVCGQHSHVHRTLSAFFHDLLHGVLHFEGKIWRTLPLLAWKPGQLTRRYIDGQRAKFVSPIALFLFSVFLLFATVSITGGDHGSADAKLPNPTGDTLADARSEVARLEAERAEAVRRGKSTADIDEDLSDTRSELKELSSLETDGVTMGTGKPSYEMPPMVAGIVGKIKGNPELFFYKLKMNAYKFSWALIPLSVPFLWLLFPFSRHFRIYDHTVFVTYSLSFMTIVFVLYIIIDDIGLESLASLATFVPPIHMYRQLRGTYDLGRFAAAWRTVLMVVFAFIALGLFVSLLVSLGALD
jgi:hypothetical protein